MTAKKAQAGRRETHGLALMDVGSRVSARMAEHVCGECGDIARRSSSRRYICPGYGKPKRKYGA